jgi:hypothetical protein
LNGGAFFLKFYNVKTKQSVEVEDSKVTVVTTKNGRKAAQAEIDGMKLFKFLGKEDLERLGA